MPQTKRKGSTADLKQTATALAAGAVAAGAAAAAAAGYYFYASKEAKENRKIAAQWATHLKQEVMRQMEKAKDLDRATVLRLIDQAAAAYQTVRSIDRQQLENAAGELKSNWKLLVQESRPTARLPKPPAKKATRAKSVRRKQARKSARAQ